MGLGQGAKAPATSAAGDAGDGLAAPAPARPGGGRLEVIKEPNPQTKHPQGGGRNPLRFPPDKPWVLGKGMRRGFSRGGVAPASAETPTAPRADQVHAPKGIGRRLAKIETDQGGRSFFTDFNKTLPHREPRP